MRMMKNKISIAVISDLHCHPEKVDYTAETFLYSDMPDRPTETHPIQSLLNLIRKEKLTTEVVLVPGDLTNRCDQAGMGAAWGFLLNVKRALKAKNLIGTIGNHDVESHAPNSPDIFRIAKNIRTDFPFANQKARTEFWGERFCIIETKSFRILVINSVSQHADKNEAKRGSFTDVDLEKLSNILISKKPKKIQVAMFHHHPIPHEDLGLGSEDLMVNGQRLISLLEKNDFQVAVHGHKHQPKIRYASGGNNSLAVFASGSLSAAGNKVLSVTRNTFHIIEFYPRITMKNGIGIIRSWEFSRGIGWKAASLQGAGFPGKTGFGCREAHERLAQKIVRYFKKQKCYKGWSEIIKRFPMVEYLIPQDFEGLKNLLEKKYGIKILYDDEGRPHQMGEISK